MWEGKRGEASGGGGALSTGVEVGEREPGED